MNTTTTTIPPTTTTSPPATTTTTVSSTTTTTVASSDLRARLLSNPDRIGYGGGATGGTNYVYVRNFNELKNAMQTRGSYVVLDPSLTNKGIGFTSPIHTAMDVTLDGSLAQGSYLYPVYPGFPENSVLLNIFTGNEQGDNVIYHNISIRGMRSSSYDSNHPSYNVGGINVRGTNVWIDHVEVTEFWDDAIGTGQQGDNITFSNLKIHNTDKGIILFYKNYGRKHVSLFNSSISAAQRTPSNSGASNLHMWNNYFYDVRYGAASAGFAGTNTSRGVDLITTISENNVFSNTLSTAEHAFKMGEHVGGPVQVKGDIYSKGNVYNGQQTRNVTFTSSPPWTVPYGYSLMPASQVRSYLLENAGPWK